MDLKHILLSAYNNLSDTFFNKRDYDNSLNYGKQKLKLAIKSGSKKGTTSAQDTIDHSYSKAITESNWNEGKCFSFLHWY